MKKTTALLIPIIIISLLGLYLGSCSKETPIKVAFTANLTGHYSEMGISARNAVIMAVEEWNLKGGINGNPIELTVVDDKADPSIAIKQNIHLIEDGNHFIIGHLLSKMTPVIDSLHNENVLFVSPTMSSSQLSGRDDNFVRVISPASQQSNIIADDMHIRDIEKVIIWYDENNSLYTVDVANNFTKRWSETLKHDAPEIVTPIPELTKLNMEAMQNTIEHIKPDAVLLIANDIDFATIAQHLRSAEQEFFLYGPHWACTKAVIPNGGAAVEGAIFSGRLPANEKSSGEQLFIQRFEERYNSTPTFVPMYAYDAANLLFTAMDNSEELNPEKVKNEIIRLGSFDAVIEKFSIDVYGDALRAMSVITIKDGKLAKVHAKDR